MVTPRISYAHLLAKPNPKHVESLLKFFENGPLPAWHRRLRRARSSTCPCTTADDTAVTYYEPNGMEALLKRLAPYYDEEQGILGERSFGGTRAPPALPSRSNRAAKWRLQSAF